ncbi:MAG: MtrB/PioB family outer membrane beta-barrel protein, partial [Sulfuricaulis sp.]|nr:MtrB/PioB family outer membrane beta-barrel protein [Sulfuricaulis sp.]
MNTSRQQFGFSQALITLAVLAAFSPARAEEGGDIAQLTAPGSSVSVGVGVASGDSNDRARFGIYNGLRKNDVNGLLGFSYLNNGDAAGRWTTAEGRNLGLDNRELSFTQQQPGDWKYSLGYGELVRHDPRTINTGLVGAGSTTPTVVRLATPGTGSELNLDLKRKSFTLGGEKWFGGSLLFEASFKNEDKDGARLFGRGFACSAAWVAAGSCLASTTQWALLMLPE